MIHDIAAPPGDDIDHDEGDEHAGKMLIHFPSEETGLIAHDCWCTPEMAKFILDGRVYRAKLGKRNKARLRRASERYREYPTARRRKALLDAISRITSLCQSHIRTDKLVEAAYWEPAEIWWPAFLDDWSVCDAGSWRWHICLLDKFRRLRDSGQHAIPYLPAHDREFYDGLPELMEVWRGADRRTIRNFSWTTDPKVAEFFAVHRRGQPFPNPVIGHAFIRKADVFAAIAGRNEKEIILDPRRLHKLTIESAAHIKYRILKEAA
jgi:hypothetical protein